MFVVRIRHDLMGTERQEVASWRVADGTRTHDNRDHNPGLYQLSYVHRPSLVAAGWRARQDSNLRPSA